jgi:hypothetical protein
MQVFSQQKLLDFLATYHKGTGNPTKSLTDKENRNLLKILKWLKHYDEYYAIINLKENKITWSYGIENYLGYTIESVDRQGVLFFRNIIHPFVREWHNLFTYAALKMFRDKTIGSIQLRKSRFMINIPVKKANGRYVFVKQMLFPFQKDENNIVISYLNVYTIIDEYRGQPLRSRFFENLTRKEKWEEYLKKYASEIVDIEKNENFTEAEFKFMNQFFYLIQLNESSTKDIVWRKEIGDRMGKIAKITTRSHIRNIKRKVKNLFFLPFVNSPELDNLSNYLQCMQVFESFEAGVIFLQKSGILSVLKHCYELTEGKIREINNF